MAARRLLYCQRCGTSLILAIHVSPSQCGSCGGTIFLATRNVTWKPFAKGWQSMGDRKFLKVLDICSAIHPDDSIHNPYG